MELVRCWDTISRVNATAFCSFCAVAHESLCRFSLTLILRDCVVQLRPVEPLHQDWQYMNGIDKHDIQHQQRHPQKVLHKGITPIAHVIADDIRQTHRYCSTKMNERNFHVRDLIANRDGNGGDQRTLSLGRPAHGATDRLWVTLELLQEGSESEYAKKAEQLTPARATLTTTWPEPSSRVGE